MVFFRYRECVKKVSAALGPFFLVFPLLFLAASLLALVGGEQLAFFSAHLHALYPPVVCTLLLYALCRRGKSENALLGCVAFCTMYLFYYGLQGSFMTVFSAVVFAFAYAAAVNHFENRYLCCVLFLAASVGLVYGISFLQPNILRLVLRGADFLRGDGLLQQGIFGLVKALLFYPLSFLQLFSDGAYGGTIVAGDTLYIGAQNIYEAIGGNAFASRFLSPDYLLCVFMPVAAYAALGSRVKGDSRLHFALFASTLCAVLGGNVYFLLIVLLLLHPALLLCAAGISAFAHIACMLLDTQIGYLRSASAVELVLHFTDTSILTAGLLVFVLSFAVFRLAAQKLQLIVPHESIRDLRLVRVLGGIENVAAFREKGRQMIVQVKNPFLVNTLSGYDMEIQNDLVIFSFPEKDALEQHYHDFDIIKTYLQ